jgi:hypothetical protein
MKEFIKPLAIFSLVLSAWALLAWAGAAILMESILYNATEEIGGFFVGAVLIIGLFIAIWFASALVKKTS